ncbi:PAS domain S-box protein [Desulfosporosinus meridiei]|uniref:histidine kinase n=1 Tax=Desulfosporosinus meridiei (strain ATCC BAA-275 / DSM 13257 / KCTC 12902 / NCIMB 13706 / S10) TaxID=768704 RepID=J7IR15_DESMD|nr:PAS domain S-box protein [Desulfosporosinus meridiei]AFQ44080.1 PAS domain S-box [Desulfosporosinus meridiei DSM 13257]
MNEAYLNNYSVKEEIQVQLESLHKKFRESQIQLQTIFDEAIIGIVLLNYETGISLCNPAFQEMLGYSENELKTMNFLEFTHPDDLIKELEIYRKVTESKIDKYQLEKRYIRKDKSIIWGWLSLTITRNSLDKPEYVIAMVENITQRKLTEESLRESEEQFRNLFENSMDGICITKPDGTIISANPAICEMLGMTDGEICAVGRKGIVDFSDGRVSKLLVEREQTGKFKGEYYAIHKSGKRIPVEATSKFYWNSKGEKVASVISRDITDRIKTRQEIDRLDRLNLIGQMAAGIGHEIRNPLTIVRGYLQLLGSRPENAVQRPTFDLMISELDRANCIITEFLSLARTKQTDLIVQSLNDILHNLYPLIEADTYSQNKQISFNPGIIPNLELNKNEISQLVLNLTRNALEAMKEQGRLTIATGLENKKVVLVIEDEGSGISSEEIEKIGTPFYTTKDNGTGLGLTTCFKIAEAHHAKIDVESSPKGTKFLIAFPIPSINP